MPLAGLLAFSAVVWVLNLWVLKDPTDPTDWQAAAEFVEPMVGERDLIRVAPHWSEAPLVFLKGAGRGVVDRRRALVGEDLVGVSTFWLIHETGRDDPWLEGFAQAGVLSKQTTQAFGSVQVTPYKVLAAPYVYRLSDHLSSAKVEHVSKTRTDVCDRWDAVNKRWGCNRPAKRLDVGQELQEIGDEPRMCVFARPLGRNRTLRITFSNVPLQQTLRLRAGLTLRGARVKSATPVAVKTLIDGVEVWNKHINFNDETWHAKDVLTQSGRATVTFEVDSDSPQLRFFCVDAFVASAK